MNLLKNFQMVVTPIIGTKNINLAGGERQRLVIARALLKNAPIVLLDEATASLDPENEILIQEAISELMKGRTVVTIAHRLRTVMDTDKIIVLDKGRLIEEGTSEELLEKEGLLQSYIKDSRKALAGLQAKKYNVHAQTTITL